MHLGHDVVQRLLQRVDARLRQVREAALLGRARHFELAHLRVNRFERLAGLARRTLDAIGLLAEIGDRLLGRAHVDAKRVQPLAVAIEHLHRFLDQPREARRLPVDVGHSRLRRTDPRLELSVGFLDARDVGVQRSGALHQHCIRGLSLGGAPSQHLQRFARIAKAMLRVRQLLVGGALLLVEPRNRFARFALPRLEPLPLLVGPAALDLEQLEFLLHLLQVVVRALQLHLEADNRLLLAMQVGIHRCDRVRHLGDARLERRDVGYRLIALGLFAGNAIAQLLDLALDAQNRASFVLAAARYQHAAAHDVSGQGRDRCRRRS